MNNKDTRILISFFLTMYYLLFTMLSGASGQLFPTIAFGVCAIIISLVFAYEILEESK